MYLENVVIHALEPQVVGPYWEVLVGAERLTDEPDLVETRLQVVGGPTLDLCIPRVPEPATGRPRLRLDLWPASGTPGVHTDPDGNPYRILDEQPAYAADTGPLVAVAVECADPDRDAAFWAWLTGWSEVEGAAARSLRHPSRRGALLELHPEAAPKDATQNRIHLDVRMEAGEDADEIEAAIHDRGGRRLQHDWGDLPWRSYTDPSGNELCVLPGPTSPVR